jgi:hypothetical protein
MKEKKDTSIIMDETLLKFGSQYISWVAIIEPINKQIP